MRILKHQIDAIGIFEVRMHEGSKILDIQMQNNTPTIWVEADPEKPVIVRRLHIFSTGKYIPEPDKKHYIGTFQLYDGRAVWHVYEEKN